MFGVSSIQIAASSSKFWLPRSHFRGLAPASSSVDVRYRSEGIRTALVVSRGKHVEQSRSMKPLGRMSNRCRLRPAASGNGTLAVNVPTALTLGRVAAIPVLVATYYSGATWASAASTGIFVLAAVTDWLDGYLARRLNQSSSFGAFLDPVADKLMVVTTLTLLCGSYRGFPAWLLTAPSIIIIAREIAVGALREWMATMGSEARGTVAVNNIGKWKTATQMIALAILLWTGSSGAHDLRLFTPSLSLYSFGIALLYVASLLTLWSMIVYFSGAIRNLAP